MCIDVSVFGNDWVLFLADARRSLPLFSRCSQRGNAAPGSPFFLLTNLQTLSDCSASRVTYGLHAVSHAVSSMASHYFLLLTTLPRQFYLRAGVGGLPLGPRIFL
jgi:hypothetical protein